MRRWLLSLWAFGAALGCSAANNDVRVDDLVLTESPGSVLVYLLEFETNEPARTTVEITPDTGNAWTLEGPGEFMNAHRFTIAGLRAEHRYRLRVEATDEDDKISSASATIDTAALPAELPPIEVVSTGQTADDTAHTILNVFRWPSGQSAPDNTFSWLLALDSRGEVVWYSLLGRRAGDLQLRDNGNLLYNYDNRGLVELDVLGNEVQHWVATGHNPDAPDEALRVDTDSIHHEVLELSNGNWLTLSTELRTLGPGQTEDCPNWALDAGQAYNVVGDVIVEFDPSTGEVLKTASSFDGLDPCRRETGGFAGTFWNTFYGMDTKDWTHGNALIFDASQNLAVWSARHSDWLVGVNFVPGRPEAPSKIAFLMGPEGSPGDYGPHPSFTPVGDPFEWAYHTHAPMFTSSGNILVFDNGNLRPGTNVDPDDANLPFSRAVEYAFDRENRTIEQVWEYRDYENDPEARYAPLLGDADELQDGSVLITYGGLTDPPSDRFADPTVKKWAKVLEVGRDGDIAFEVRIRDEAETNFTGYSVYRAERVRGFPR